MRLTEQWTPPPGVISVDWIWIDGTRYKVGDDGDTLIPSPETEVDMQERHELIATLEAAGQRA